MTSSKSNGHSKNGPSQIPRDRQIRDLAQEMNALLAEKNRVHDRICQLSVRAKYELGYTSGDFTIVCEVLSAIGNATPVIAKEAEPETTWPITQKALVYNLLAKHGPATVAKLQQMAPAITSISVHLAKLKNAGRVVRDYPDNGPSTWSVK